MKKKPQTQATGRPASRERAGTPSAPVSAPSHPESADAKGDPHAARPHRYLRRAIVGGNNKTSLALFGPPGVGKTALLKTLAADKTVCLDLEAGMKSVQDWPGASIPVRTFGDFRDLAVLIGGADPAADRTPTTAIATTSMCGASTPAAASRSSWRRSRSFRQLDHRAYPAGHGVRQAAAGSVL